jgi:DNA-binding LacI/PurR family transcriptional regulator
VVRLRAFEHGFGLPVPPGHVLLTRSYGESWGARLVARYAALNPRPEAVFAASDELAVGFVKGALALGLEPLRDYQIIGFDGQERGRQLHEGPLTTIQVPAAEMGRRGAELLADRLLNPDQPARQLRLGCTLFEGNTVRNLSAGAQPS